MPRIRNTICARCGHDRFDHLRDVSNCTKCACPKFEDSGVTKAEHDKREKRKARVRDDLDPARRALYAEIAAAVDRYLKSVGVHLKTLANGQDRKPGRKKSYSTAEEIQAILPPKQIVVEPFIRDSVRRAHEGNGEIKLGKAHKLILTTLKRAPGGTLPKATLAARCVYSADAGHFNNVLGEMRGIYIDGSDPISILQAGATLIGDVEPMPKGHALLEHWKKHKRVGKCGREILDALWRFKEDPLTKEEIAEGTESGYEPDGGHFNNELGALKTLGVIERAELSTDRPHFVLVDAIRRG